MDQKMACNYKFEKVRGHAIFKKQITISSCLSLSMEILYLLLNLINI